MGRTTFHYTGEGNRAARLLHADALDLHAALAIGIDEVGTQGAVFGQHLLSLLPAHHHEGGGVGIGAGTLAGDRYEGQWCERTCGRP